MNEEGVYLRFESGVGPTQGWQYPTLQCVSARYINLTGQRYSLKTWHMRDSLDSMQTCDMSPVCASEVIGFGGTPPLGNKLQRAHAFMLPVTRELLRRRCVAEDWMVCGRVG